MTKAFLFVAPLVLVLAISGCGGDGDSNGGDAGSGASTSAGSGGSGGQTGIGGSAAGPTLIEDSGCPDAAEPREPMGTTHTVGDGTPASCTEAALRAAVAAATHADNAGTVLFDCGDAEHQITLTSQLEIDGKLMIDGENAITLSGGGQVRIMNLEHDSELVVQRIRLVDGTTDESGGAIHHPWYGTLHAIDVHFENNHAVQDTDEIGGGAVFAGGLRTALFSGCSFIGNSGSNGGGILNRGSTLTIVDSVFRDNEATSYSEGGGQWGNGGGLYIDGMAYDDVDGAESLDFHLCGSVFFNNAATRHGSAVFGYFYAGTVAYIDRCHFDSNSFVNSPSGSGGLYHGAVPLYLTNSTFSNNRAMNGNGAAIQMEGSEGTVVNAANCTFFGNEAGTNAGGIFASNSPLTCTNCTFAENKADYAPAIFKGQSGSVSLKNTVFFDNLTDNEYSAVACHESFDDAGGNLQWPATKNNGNADTPCVEGILFADPLLGELTDNGGPIPTMVPADGSPAIGVGADCPETDQNGALRPAACAAGAAEPTS